MGFFSSLFGFNEKKRKTSSSLEVKPSKSFSIENTQNRSGWPKFNIKPKANFSEERTQRIVTFSTGLEERIEKKFKNPWQRIVALCLFSMDEIMEEDSQAIEKVNPSDELCIPDGHTGVSKLFGVDFLHICEVSMNCEDFFQVTLDIDNLESCSIENLAEMLEEAVG